MLRREGAPPSWRRRRAAVDEPPLVRRESRANLSGPFLGHFRGYWPISPAAFSLGDVPRYLDAISGQPSPRSDANAHPRGERSQRVGVLRRGSYTLYVSIHSNIAAT